LTALRWDCSSTQQATSTPSSPTRTARTPTRQRFSVYEVTDPGGAVGDAYTAPNFSGFNELSKGAVDASGRVYVTNRNGTTISVIDSNNPAAPIDVGGRPISIAYNPTTQHTYVTVSSQSAGDPNAYTLSVYDITSGTPVKVGDVYTQQPSPFGGTGEQYTWLSDMAVSPDGSHIYVTNVIDSTVTVMDATTGAIDHTIAIPKDQFGNGAPFKIAFSPNGEHVYVLDQRGSVSEISFAQTTANV
jgi:YVTN family beta-propeller protein